ncbi:MAG: hypothetical protein HYR62_09755 [Actinobacteria bacterium]|nr:hypothetical protein [Actinomycetota bacterium]MBI3687960.1 hypothetical protein [Actinomycetota bacterium]
MSEPSALLAGATRKAGVVWLGVPGQPRPVLVWPLWQEEPAVDGVPGGVLYVVAGPGEQPAPGLAGASQCAVTVRSAAGGRVLTWRAEVTRVTPGGAEWDAVVPTLLSKRLNLPDAAGAGQRWAAECAVLRLAPTGELVESGDTLPTGSLAAAPPPSPARTPTRVPFTLHRSPHRRP